MSRDIVFELIPRLLAVLALRNRLDKSGEIKNIRLAGKASVCVMMAEDMFLPGILGSYCMLNTIKKFTNIVNHHRTYRIMIELFPVSAQKYF
jgi:hypothetical protein